MVHRYRSALWLLVTVLAIGALFGTSRMPARAQTSGTPTATATGTVAVTPEVTATGTVATATATTVATAAATATATATAAPTTAPTTTPTPSTGLAISNVAAKPTVMLSDGGLTAYFVVTFDTNQLADGQVLFGSGPGCSGLIETATQDAGAGTLHHSVKVSGDDLRGGAWPVLPGQTYWYEAQATTSTSVTVNDNGGKCYSVAVPAVPTP